MPEGLSSRSSARVSLLRTATWRAMFVRSRRTAVTRALYPADERSSWKLPIMSDIVPAPVLTRGRTDLSPSGRRSTRTAKKGHGEPTDRVGGCGYTDHAAS